MTKVCPNCGNDRFEAVQVKKEVVILNGYEEPIEVKETESLHRNRGRTCTECRSELIPEQLVSEDYFHEVIAAREHNESVSNRNEVQ